MKYLTANVHLRCLNYMINFIYLSVASMRLEVKNQRNFQNEPPRSTALIGLDQTIITFLMIKILPSIFSSTIFFVCWEFSVADIDKEFQVQNQS